MNKITYALTLVSGYMGFAGTALAQSSYNFRDVYTDLVFSGSGFGTGNRVIDLLQGLAGFLIIVGSVLAGIAIIWSGIVFMSAGSNSTRVANAKAIFKNGLIGALILFAVGILINTIIALVASPESFFGI